MHELIDIYIRFQIAIITLLVPILVFYVNNASIAKKEKEDAYDKKIKELQNTSQLDTADSTNFASQVTELHAKIKELQTQRAIDSNLLNPLRQTKRIYSVLLSSFLLIVINVGVRENVLNSYNHMLSCTLIIISLLLFLIAVSLIARVALVAIKSKEDVEKSL